MSDAPSHLVRRWGLPALAAALLILAGAAPKPAAAQTSEGALACDVVLSGPVFAKWSDEGGAKSRLGCPTAKEAATAVSPQGSTARAVTFGEGAILWHASGPHAGQTFVVSGCAWRLYFQYGGAGGWLGLPISDPVNNPDGQRQAFEGGTMTYLRAPNECSAEPAAGAKAAAAAPAPARSPLDLFFDPARGDHITAASASSAAAAGAAHYQRLDTQAFVLSEEADGAVRLKLYWNEALGDHVTVATAEGERDALARGYQFEASQGFVYADPRPGTKPLKQFRNAASGHSLLVATAQGEADAAAQGFAFVRIEGYAPVGP